MKDIEKIVEDICELAPELKEDRDNVRKVVASLLESKPDVVVDEVFVRNLQQKLQGSIRAQKASMGEHKESEGALNRVLAFFEHKTVVGLAVLVLVVLVALPFIDLSKGQYATNFSLSPQVKDTNSRLAFGSLLEYSSEEATVEAVVEEFTALDSYEADITTDSVAPSNTRMMQAEGMGGDAMGMYVDDAYVSPEMKGGMISPDYQYPVYTYDGPMPAIDDEGYVYRREIGANKSVSGLLAGFDLGLIDLSSFRNIGLQRIELTTTNDPAYTISVDMQQGEVSIYRVWTDRYYDTMPAGIPYSQVDPKEVTKIANAFLKKHGIDVSAYGSPEVEDQSYYAMPMMDVAVGVARESMPVDFMPVYSVNVRYPLVVDGMRVVEQGGYPAGINVSVNVSGGYVESVWGLTTQSYERSLYPQVTDTGKILDMLAYGGYSRGPIIDPAYTKTVSVSTQEPGFVLMKYWKYDEKMGRSTELLVPAIMFDIDQKAWNSRNIYVQDAVVIPLVKDIIDNSWDRPIPMPYLIEEATSEGSGGVVVSMPTVMVEPDAVPADILE